MTRPTPPRTHAFDVAMRVLWGTVALAITVSFVAWLWDLVDPLTVGKVALTAAAVGIGSSVLAAVVFDPNRSNRNGGTDA